LARKIAKIEIAKTFFKILVVFKLLIPGYGLTSTIRLQCHRVSRSGRHRAYQDQMSVLVYFLVRVVMALVVLLIVDE